MSDRRRDLALLALVGLLLFLPFVGSRDLWNPNEPIYGQAVREMRVAGEWVLPSVNGEAFAEKPILYFWLARVAVALLGEHETALRLPSVLAGIGSMIAVYLLGFEGGGRRRARIASVLFVTTYAVWWNARTIQMDLLLTAATAWALLFAYRTMRGTIGPWHGWAATGIFTGLGVLSKGPAALIAIGAPLMLWSLAGGRWRQLLSPPAVVGGLIAIAVPAPWLMALWARDGGASVQELMFRQAVTRALDPWDHVKPAWYYLREFWMDMAPWSLSVPLAFRLPDRDDAERSLDRFACVWIVAIVAGFSISASKRSPYILPVAPAVAILAAAVVDRWLAGRLSRGRERALLGLTVAFGGLLALGGFAGWRHALPRYPEMSGPILGAVSLLVAGGLAIVAGPIVYRRRRFAIAGTVAAFMLLLYALAASWWIPAIDLRKSSRPFCAAVERFAGPEGDVRAFRTWRWRSGYTYYLGRPVPRLESDDELLQRWGGEPLFVIVERGRLEAFHATVGAVEPLTDRKIGSRHAYLFSNGRASAGPPQEVDRR